MLDETPATMGRREFCRGSLGLLLAAGLSGCTGGEVKASVPEKIWGQIGITNGRFQKPRAIAIDEDDLLYIVDMTARIQVFDRDGKFIRAWQTPVHDNGRPTGLSITHDGLVAVADTHYYRVLFYTKTGELQENLTIGGTMGQGPGEFGFVTDVAQDAFGNYYVSEYGEFDRIQKFSPERKYILEWGGHGGEPGKFARPQSMTVAVDGLIWITDACNHRIQVFDETGKLVKLWGEQGPALGQLSYPYSGWLDGDRHFYICEYGNHRVQKFSLDGKSLGIWGSEGRGPGQLFNPWAIVMDSKKRIHVLDSNNNRVQRFIL
jgi:NHL repeat